MLNLKIRENRKMEKWEIEKIIYELVEIKDKILYLNTIVETTTGTTLDKGTIITLFNDFFEEYKTQLHNLFLLLDSKELDNFKNNIIPAIKKDSNITDVELEELEKMVSYYELKPLYYGDGQNGGYELVYSLFDFNRFYTLGPKLANFMWELANEILELITELEKENN
ncbi:hypothetical protein [Streptobacillus canis]|uniref:hypothetical protein n=1 Tax=Streptobacillus canis TaxID=2678686 RepID=UPI0012E2219F|nr:hypothetical protein [Streptobacillus canis]